eukprot:CAMPEP_0117000780 /NCGR_PEP_ID=MMETSP0472-20121206/3003_1 /TAXON_ID=693140 ORGANISM="Tiarina fusus, Strain LIS" /NCGR_SAMPLE_ID=MMETSP0472 /ASSEMBLY_ACC=CAM_ASM_000603 /LENGTH=251 /DNA_ID=CAMNT_0004700577 /DNA_START=227 /DNA_END=978 /DNA_ORIENTATION=+
MTPLKGVRFSDAAPVLAENQWTVPKFTPAPVFSPTQVPAQERVLHSIFSPSYHQTKSLNARVEQPAKPPPSSYPQAIELFHTPQEISTPRRNQEENDMFFSPHGVNSISPISTTSGVTESRPSPPRAMRRGFGGENKTSTSSKTLSTIDMLNFKFIQKCSSVSDLQLVVKCLLEQKSPSPRLLRAANERIAQLRQPTKERTTKSPARFGSNAGESPGKYFSGGSPVNLSRITTGNASMDSIEPSKTSLNFS